jgi:uncharacterized protein with FMN-binding domain
MKRKLVRTAIFITVIAVVAIIGFNEVNRAAQKAMAGVMIDTANAAGVADGAYIGEYEILPVKVVVLVNVENEEITSIEILKHQKILGGKAEKITVDILAHQSLDVDTVTGATVSSKTILKAVENALQKGKTNNE